MRIIGLFLVIIAQLMNYVNKYNHKNHKITILANLSVVSGLLVLQNALRCAIIAEVGLIV